MEIEDQDPFKQHHVGGIYSNDVFGTSATKDNVEKNIYLGGEKTIWKNKNKNLNQIVLLFCFVDGIVDGISLFKAF